MSSRGNVKNTYYDVHYSFTFSIWTADMALIRGFHSSSDKEAVKTSKDYIRLVKKFGHVGKYPKVLFIKSNSRRHYSPKTAVRAL